MRILALETSTELGSCALWENGESFERYCPSGRPHSETLLPLVRELLAEAGAGLSSFDAIAFGAGPGAFTGLRVACAVAQGLAVASDLPVVPIGTLEALAVESSGKRLLTLLDARMNEVYSATFEKAGDISSLRLVGEVRVSPPGEIAIPEGEDWLACGNALSAYPGLAERLHGAGLAIRPEVMPTAKAVAALAAARLEQGASVDAGQAAPLYIRDKVAQTVAERLAGGGKA